MASISGPGGLVALGAGAGPSEEGLTAEFNEDADNMITGADGTPMHTLNPSRAGKVTVRLLKTSPTNAALSAMYALQRTSASSWGQNTITITNNSSGDVYTCQLAAFAKFPSNTYAKNPNMLEWTFNVGQMDAALGAGV